MPVSYLPDSLEDSNKQLLYEVQQKDEDIMLLTDELHQLTERVNAMNRDYSEEIGESADGCHGIWGSLGAAVYPVNKHRELVERVMR